LLRCFLIHRAVLVVFGAAAPRREVVLYHGSGICRRTRQQHAERGHQLRDTALVRNFVVLTLQHRCVTELSSPSSFWERLLCHAQPSPPVLLWSIIVVTSHPLRHGTVVTVVVLGTAVVSRAAVAVGVLVVHHCVIVVHHWWCHSNHRNHDTLVLATCKGVATGGQGPVGLLPIVHCEKYRSRNNRVRISSR
jgi:hypothetical protein